MSRRHLSLALVAFASLVLSACSASPTAPEAATRTLGPAGMNADFITPPPTDTTARSGYSGSNG